MLNILTKSQTASLLSSSELSQHEPPGLVLGDLARPDDLQHHLLAVVADEDSLPGAGLGAWPGVSRGVALTREQQRPHTLCRHTSHRRARLNSPNLVFKHWKHILDF